MERIFLRPQGAFGSQHGLTKLRFGTTLADPPITSDDVLQYDPLTSGLFTARAMTRNLSRQELFYHTIFKKMKIKHYYEGLLIAQDSAYKFDDDDKRSPRLWNTIGILHAQLARYMAGRSIWSDGPKDLKALEKTLLPTNQNREKAQLIIRHMKQAQEAFARAVDLSGGFDHNAEPKTGHSILPHRAYLMNYQAARLEMLNNVPKAQVALQEQSQNDPTTRQSAMLQSLIQMNQGMVHQRNGDTQGFNPWYEKATKNNGMLVGERDHFYYLLI